MTGRDGTASSGRRRKPPPSRVPRPHTLLSSTLPPSPLSRHPSHLERPCTPANTTTSSNSCSSVIQASERCALPPLDDHRLLSLLSTTPADFLSNSLAYSFGSLTTLTRRATSPPLVSISRLGPSSWRGRPSNSKS